MVVVGMVGFMLVELMGIISAVIIGTVKKQI
jgi:hypothetical protein